WSAMYVLTGAVVLSSSASPSGFACSLSAGTLILTSEASSSSSTLACSGQAGVYTIAVTGALTGTSATLSRTVIVTVTVEDFSISTSPASIAVNAGTQGVSVITIGGLNGFAGTVTLTPTISAPTLA